MTLSIDVVMPVHNRWELTESCLAHLHEQTLTHTVIVCDNGSTDGTAERLRAQFPDARAVELGANLGYSAACNRGVEAGSGEVVVLLNNDVDCRPDFLERLVAQFHDGAGLGSVAPLLLRPGEEQIDSFGLQQVNFITGLPGGMAGYVPWFAVMLLCAALGYAWGKGERWLLREVTPARMVMLGGAVVAALWYEAGLSTMLVQFRAAVALALAVRVAGVFLQRRASRRQGEWQAVRYPAGPRNRAGN